MLDARFETGVGGRLKKIDKLLLDMLRKPAAGPIVLPLLPHSFVIPACWPNQMLAALESLARPLEPVSHELNAPKRDSVSAKLELFWSKWQAGLNKFAAKQMSNLRETSLIYSIRRTRALETRT